MSDPVQCPDCKGEGGARVYRGDAISGFLDWDDCIRCSGSGSVAELPAATQRPKGRRRKG
jgi:DnaJ-class molecular chaperone